MNILLSNDDGYKAEGIKILEDVLASAGHVVYVSAPDREQSGKSHGFTISGEVIATEYAPRHFHISGTPADCIMYSHHCALFPVSFDVVISGINHGYNQSTDIVYSGTCAAARQAALYEMKAIAVSASVRDRKLFEKTASFVADNLDSFLPMIAKGSFMNINVPLAFNGGWEAASIGEIIYNDKIAVKRRNGDQMILEMEGAAPEYRPSGSLLRADYEVCLSGKASVSIVEALPALSEEGMRNLLR